MLDVVILFLPPIFESVCSFLFHFICVNCKHCPTLILLSCVSFSPSIAKHSQNYTGDRLNFGLAAEQAKSEGYKMEVDQHTLLCSYSRSHSFY